MSAAPRSLHALADAGLRGVGQVLFQDSPVSGLLFLAGLAVVSPLYALAALLGSLIGSVFAGLLRADRSLLQTGMFGFNGALTALALLFFLKPTVLTWLCVVLAAACSSVLLLGCMTLLERWKLPALTAPFVLITFCVFLASAGFGRLETTSLMPTASLPKAATVRFDVLEPEKRPVMADADSRGVDSVLSVEIRSEHSIRHRLLFNPGHGLEERLTREQFV